MRKAKGILLGTTGFMIVVFSWNLLSISKVDPAIPSVNQIIKTLFILLGDNTFYEHIASSLTMICLGITLAVLGGFLLGVTIYHVTILKKVFMPIIETMRGIAALTLFPLLISTIGIGIGSRVFVICWTAWPAVLLSTLHSLNINKDIVEASMLDGADEWDIMVRMRIPIALNSILTGVRIAISGGWIGLVSAEMLGATKGLGYYLLWSAQSFEYPKVYAVIIVIAVFGGVMNLAVSAIQKLIKTY